MEGIQIFDRLVGYNKDIVYLKINGFVDTSTTPVLMQKLKSLIDKGYVQFIVDMSGVSYVSSAGWGAFVGEIKEIREGGGDIKLVGMIPEVYDVFEMLEFHKIMNTYDSVEEAMNDFDIARGFDITDPPPYALEEGPVAEKPAETDVQVLPKMVETKEKRQQSFPFAKRPKIDPAHLPLPEKIKQVIIEKPFLGVLGIRRELRKSKYGNTKVGLFRIYRILRELNLDTKDKRYRFYRSR
jgi:anti-sigma B factor antagonist